MKKYRVFLLSAFLPLIAAAALLSACCPICPDHGETEYAVVLYSAIGGDMDYIVEDVWEEIRTVLPDKKVRVFCRHKYGVGGDQFTGKWGDPGEVVTFELTRDTRFEELRDKGLQDPTFKMFNPESLAEVLAAARRAASPSKGCVLIFFGHGGGFNPTIDYPKERYGTPAPVTRGILSDEWFEGKVTMDMYEITRGIEDSHVGRLAGFLFNDCLMGSIEVLTQLADCADYFIATPFMLTSVDNPMMPYLVKNLAGNSFETAARNTLLESKERLLAAFHSEEPADFPGNVELLKASELDSVCKATQSLSERLCQLYPTQREAIDRATDRVYWYYSQHPFFDLLDYALVLSEETGDGQLRDIATEMEAAFGRTILEQLTIETDTHPTLDSYSLSVTLLDSDIYQNYPTRGLFSFPQSYEYSRFHQLTHWGDWLNANLHFPTGNPCGQQL